MSETRLRSGLDPGFAASYDLVPVEHDPFAVRGAPAEGGYTARGEPIFLNEAGQPFTMSGAPPVRAQASDLTAAIAGAPAAQQPGYFAQIGRDISDFLARPAAHVRAQLAAGGQNLADVARGYLGQQEQLRATDWSGQPLLGWDPETWKFTGRIPALSEMVASGMAGAVPGEAGVLGAGPRIPRLGRLRGGEPPVGEVPAGAPPGIGHNLPPEATPLEGVPPPAAAAAAAPPPTTAPPPFDAMQNAGPLADRLRDAHLARGGAAIPLSGARMPVAPPPHIQTPEDVEGLVNRYADLAKEGEVAKNWYLESGRAIANAANDQETAGKLTSAIARTSPQTDVSSNLMHAITLHNQAMLGEPLSGGRFPAAMGADVEKYYYGNNPVTGEKIAPFHNALDVGWNPDFPHTYVNDVWNMRALEYPGKNGNPVYNGAPLFDETPTLGQHNFTRIIAERALDELQARETVQRNAEYVARGETPPQEPVPRWDPKELQAATWAAIKSRVEQDPLSTTAQNYATGLARNYAQASWEAAPGLTTGHLPEFHTAPLEDRQAFHNDVRSVFLDDQGNDIIHRHLGLLTGPSFDAPGYFRGNVAPGTQALAAVGQAPGGWRVGVDPASRELMNVGEAVRSLITRQDEFAWHKPTFVAELANKPNLANMADIRIGRSLTNDEAGAIGNEMQRLTGSNFFSPIATQQGYRLLNVPAETGLTNKQFQGKVRDLVASDLHPQVDTDIVHAYSDGNYVPNDWREQPNGQNYLGEIRRSGRPDVQRAAAELLATLGPKMEQVEERWAQTHGWTPNRATRIWNDPVIQQHANAVVPNPPRPWLQRPAPPSTGPPLFSGVPIGAFPSPATGPAAGQNAVP